MSLMCLAASVSLKCLFQLGSGERDPWQFRNTHPIPSNRTFSQMPFPWAGLWTWASAGSLLDTRLKTESNCTVPEFLVIYLPEFSDCKRLWTRIMETEKRVSGKEHDIDLRLMEQFGSLLFSVPLGLVFLDICFGWVTVVAVSFTWNSFCIMHGKGWEILKISQHTCTEKWVVLMGSHKAWVVPEAAWSSGVGNGLKPCLLVVKSLWTFFLVWKYNMSFPLNSVTIAVLSTAWLSSNSAASLLRQPLGGGILAPAPQPCRTFVVTTWHIESVSGGKNFSKASESHQISVSGAAKSKSSRLFY